MNFFSIEAGLVEIVAELIENPKLTKVIVANTEAEAQDYEAFIRALTSDYFNSNAIIYVPGFFKQEFSF